MSVWVLHDIPPVVPFYCHSIICGRPVWGGAWVPVLFGNLYFSFLGNHHFSFFIWILFWLTLNHMQEASMGGSVSPCSLFCFFWKPLFFIWSFLMNISLSSIQDNHHKILLHSIIPSMGESLSRCSLSITSIWDNHHQILASPHFGWISDRL